MWTNNPSNGALDLIRQEFCLILMLHRTSPASTAPLDANEDMNVSPQMLSEFILHAERHDWQFISIDELYERLVDNRTLRKTIVLTADDGYKDNITHGLDILRRHNVPLCLYITTAFPEGNAKLWWYALEEALLNEADTCHVTSSKAKGIDINKTFLRLRKIFLEQYSFRPDDFFVDYFPKFELNWRLLNDRYCLTWSDINCLASDPLVTIGAHTISHPRLSTLPKEALYDEMAGSRERIAEVIGMQVDHFCYPFGGKSEASKREFSAAKSIGFRTATTTRFGFVLAGHKEHVTALPRAMLKATNVLEDFIGWQRIAKMIIKNQVVVTD